MVRAFVSDTGGFIRTNTLIIGTIKFPIDVKKGGSGVAVGKVAEHDGLFEVDNTSQFNKDVYLKKNLIFSNFLRNTEDIWVPVVRNGILDYTLRKIVDKISHTDYPNEKDNLATLSFLSFWNGAYNANGTSNLAYCNSGEIQSKPYNLYDNETGTTGTVYLNDYAYNYTYLEIFFRRNANLSYWGNHFYKSVRVYVANDKIANLDIAYPPETNLTQICTKLIGITGNTLISKRECYANIKNDGTVQVGEQSNIYIVKVVGYK